MWFEKPRTLHNLIREGECMRMIEGVGFIVIFNETLNMEMENLVRWDLRAGIGQGCGYAISKSNEVHPVAKKVEGFGTGREGDQEHTIR